jgi:diguanylate cyclase (GGDEF)-like protein
MIFLVAYTLMGASALHPSVREIGQSVAGREARLSRGLLASLTVAALIAPAVLIMQALTGGDSDRVAIGVSCTVLFLLVVARMAGLLRRVEVQARQLRELARVDALTGLPNRRTWGSELPVAVERARLSEIPLSVAMMDLDHFKKFNDEYGHPAGDRLLAGAAAAWRKSLRTVDLIARYGGEEFIVLLPDADSTATVSIIERLRVVTPAGQSFSAGVATWDGAESSDELISRADAMLYEAKRSGRNRTLFAEPPSVDAADLTSAVANSPVA